MKKIILALAPLLLLCACTNPTLRDSFNVAHEIGNKMPSGNENTWDDADDVPPACSRRATLPVKSRQLYEDYYGTMLTLDASSLRTPQKSYRWGITNPTPLGMAYFASYVKPGGKYGRFRTYIYIDSGIKANMVFTFRADTYNGVVLKNLTIRPGQTRMVEFDISGVKKLFIGSELRINHDTARKIVIGEPEFYTCR